MEGLLLGMVKENYDADHPGMLRVTLPALGAEGDETFWARMTTPYAGKDYGSYFLPEVGDAVVVGFVGGDSQSPVVLGCFWHNKNTFPAETVTEKNEQKAIITKGGNSILITDGDKSGITVKTKAGHSITISDQDKTIKLATNNGKNIILLDEGNSSVEILSGDKLTIKAKEILIEGKTTIKGSDITGEANNGLTLKGKTVKLEGNSTKISGQTLEATGSTSVKVESSAVLTLKGSITKIN